MSTSQPDELTPPDEDDEHTGSWSDWIVKAPAPKPQYENGYDDYDDEYYDDDDDYDPPPLRQRGGGPAHRRGSSRSLSRNPGPRSTQQWMVPLLGVLAVLAITAAVAVQFAKATEPDTTAQQGMPTVPAASTTTTVQPVAAASPDLCPNETIGTNVRGNGPGSTRSSTDVILAVQNRYYVERNGQRVREMFVPDSPTTPTAEAVQAGIDSIPAGTTYCVQIMPGPFVGQHIMVVTETHLDKTHRIWPAQLVITTAIGDRTLVSAVVPMPDDGTTPR